MIISRKKEKQVQGHGDEAYKFDFVCVCVCVTVYFGREILFHEMLRRVCFPSWLYFLKST